MNESLLLSLPSLHVAAGNRGISRTSVSSSDNGGFHAEGWSCPLPWFSTLVYIHPFTPSPSHAPHPRWPRVSPSTESSLVRLPGQQANDHAIGWQSILITTQLLLFSWVLRFCLQVEHMSVHVSQYWVAMSIYFLVGRIALTLIEFVAGSFSYFQAYKGKY